MIFHRVDRKLMQGSQWVYDLLLDGGGVLAGHYRAAFLVAVFAKGVAAAVLEASILSLVCWAAIACIFQQYVRLHFRQARQQQMGMYERLNLEAMLHQDQMGSRLGGILVLTLLSIAASGGLVSEFLRGMITTLLFAGWYYSMTVMVRDRDEARFKRADLAWGAG